MGTGRGGWKPVVAAFALLCAAASPASAQLPSLPPIGQPPPPGEQPQPQPQQPSPSPPGPVESAPGSVTDRVDVASSGFFADETLVPPLTPRWRLKPGGRAIVGAEGRVYLFGGGGMSAVDPRDGKQLWSVPNAGANYAAYARGLLFTTGGDFLNAYRADTGAAV